MANRTCLLCSQQHYARGWCKSHYHRWNRYGDPLHVPRRVTDIERFWSKVAKTDTCWLWNGTARSGYGVFHWGGRHAHQSTGAHRYAYMLEKGEIGEGLVLDHLCRVPLCVRPDHLEPVTQRENILRGVAASAVNHAKTHCIRGHEFTRENTRRGSNGHRSCRACDREGTRNRLQQNGAAAFVSENARLQMRNAVKRYPEATTKQLATLLGWSRPHAARVKAVEFGGRPKGRSVCKIEGCDGLVSGRGWCKKHYVKFRTYGDPLFEYVRPERKCEREDCQRKHLARGLCSMHYNKERRAG